MTNDKNFIIRLPGSLLEELKEKAWRMRLSTAELIRQALAKEITN